MFVNSLQCPVLSTKKINYDWKTNIWEKSWFEKSLVHVGKKMPSQEFWDFQKRLFLQNTNRNLRDSFVLFTSLLPKERKTHFLHKNNSVAKLISFSFTCEWFGFTSCFKMLFVIIYVIVLWLLCVQFFLFLYFHKKKNI